jgi:outer membrane protein assembly factor BamD
VQEVLAEREFRIGHFYLMRESYAAAIARLKTVTDSYPLYSKADDALMLLGSAYEREIDTIRAAKFDETMKGKMIATQAKEAAEAYDRIITRYPVAGRADDARARLQALHLPVPTATPEAIAQNKSEEDSREKSGHFGKLLMNFEKHPDMASSTHGVGEPPLVSAAETGAPEVLQQTTRALAEAAGTPSASVELVGKNGAPAPNQPTPRSDNQAQVEIVPPTGNDNAAAPPAQPPAAVPPSQPDPNAIPDLAAAPGAAVAPSQPAIQPATQPATQPPAQVPPADNAAVAPAQVNDAANADAAAAPVSTGKDSSSNKKKKKKKADISTGISVSPPTTTTPPATTPPPNQ